MKLLDLYTSELDILVERIATKQEAEDGLDKGRAENAIYFIALLLNPSNPNMNRVRDDAVKRFKSRL